MKVNFKKHSWSWVTCKVSNVTRKENNHDCSLQDRQLVWHFSAILKELFREGTQDGSIETLFHYLRNFNCRKK